MLTLLRINVLRPCQETFYRNNTAQRSHNFNKKKLYKDKREYKAREKRNPRPASCK